MGTRVTFTIEVEREDDGRWLAEVLETPGVLVYGKTPVEAINAAKALCLRVIADRLSSGELEIEGLQFEACAAA